MQLTTGTASQSANNYAIMYLGNYMRFGGGERIFEASIKTPDSVLAAHDWQMRFGYGNTINLSAPTRGAYFEWNADSSSQQWMGKTVNGSTPVKTTGGSAITANTWYDLRIVVSSDGDSVSFYVNGTQLGNSVTTQIPTALSGSTPFGPFLQTNATAVSRTQKTILVDYVYLRDTFNPGR
jgi:hypothetical protein